MTRRPSVPDTVCRNGSAEELRGIFDEDPELYDRARPGYPDALFRALSEPAEIGPGARVAEIGPGTGQATATLAAGGARVVAVELGAALAAALQRNLTAAPVEVVVCPFEDWQLPSEPFDTLVAFTAWHWLDPAVRAAKAGAALHPGGALATISTTHVLGGTDRFFADVQDCYERWDPSTPPGLRLPAAGAIPPAVDEIDDYALPSAVMWEGTLPHCFSGEPSGGPASRFTAHDPPGRAGSPGTSPRGRGHAGAGMASAIIALLASIRRAS